MKAKLEEQKPDFKPVSFTITCETQEELDNWGGLFNHAIFAKFLGDDKDFYKVLKRMGARINKGHEDLLMVIR